jgi:hypothetical protein
MKILGPDKFSKEDIDAMRKTLHELECFGVMNLSEVLWEGCVGWKNIPDAEVVEEYQNIYGETDNVELVICNKKVNEEQGKIIAKFNDIK